MIRFDLKTELEHRFKRSFPEGRDILVFNSEENKVVALTSNGFSAGDFLKELEGEELVLVDLRRERVWEIRRSTAEEFLDRLLVYDESKN